MNKITTFTAGEKPKLCFQTEAAVWCDNNSGSLCYCTSMERAKWIAAELNKVKDLQAEIKTLKARDVIWQKKVAQGDKEIDELVNERDKLKEDFATTCNVVTKLTDENVKLKEALKEKNNG